MTENHQPYILAQHMENALRNDYSETEQALFNQLGFGHLMDHIPAIGLYKMAGEQVLITGMKGAKVEALRRGMKALSVCSPYRMTPEFDDLVTIKDEDNNVKVYIVLHDGNSDVKGHAFTTKEQADKALAEFIMGKSEETDDDTTEALAIAFNAEEYEEVREIWNCWSAEENDAEETFSVQETILDSKIKDFWENHQPLGW